MGVVRGHVRYAPEQPLDIEAWAGDPAARARNPQESLLRRSGQRGAEGFHGLPGIDVSALWVETFFHQLPLPGDVDAWKTVEAFRAAVVGSARPAFLKISNKRRRITRPRLDIERLLGRAPDLAAVTAPAPATVRHVNQR